MSEHARKRARAVLRGRDSGNIILLLDNFIFAILRYAELSHVDLGGANFSHTDLVEATLSDTNLTGVSLRGAKLNNANLRGADLSGADLSGADLSGADLSGADLSGAIVGRTVFGDLDLHATKGLETIHHEGPSTIGTDTHSHSYGEIPETFLREVGLDDTLIHSVRILAKKTIKYGTYFISYAWQDQGFAEKLYRSLQREGIRCWLLPEKMNTGHKEWDIFDVMICHYDKLLLVLSEHSLAHSWIAQEVERTLHKETRKKSIVLYPLRVDKAILTCEETWAKEMKEGRHIDDFEGWMDPQEYEKSFNLLLQKLRVKIKEK